MQTDFRQLDEKRCGYTLTELVLVLFILGTLSAVATMRLGDVLDRTRIRAAEVDLTVLREGFTGASSASGYLADMRTLPGFSPAYLRVHNLLSPTNVLGCGGVILDDGIRRTGYAAYSCFTNWNPETERGWRGPYVRLSAGVKNTEPSRAGLFPAPADRRTPGDTTFAERGFFPRIQGYSTLLYAYGCAGEQALADPWGNPYVLQIPPSEAFDSSTEERRFHYARFVSAGPDGVLQTPCFTYTSLNADSRRLLRLAGRLATGSVESRGDDIVLFLDRPDSYERDE